jgi:hypothetical protein
MGEYEMGGLQPGFEYRIFVVDPEDDSRRSLSPRWTNSVTVGAGEHAEWNCVVTQSIRVSGRVLTAQARTPVAAVGIAVEKAGERLQSISVRTDTEGAYELVLNTGPGLYRISATPQSTPEGVSEFIAERFAQEVELREGQALELDLEVFEPILFPVRVLDAAGNPVESIRSQLSFKLPDGKRYGMGNSHRLDAQGRRVFRIFHPVEHFTLEVSAFPDGPPQTTEEIAAAVGTALPERTFMLEPTADLTGRLLDAAGEPLANLTFTVHSSATDGERDSFTLRTGDDGGFEAAGRLRAFPTTLELVERTTDRRWASRIVHPPAGGTLALGDVMVLGE